MTLFGKLTLDAIPYHEPIIMVTLAIVAAVGLGVTILITRYKKWGVLWFDWLTSVDHKRLGVMYITLALVMLIRGFSDALMMRAQLALATNGSPGYLPPEHYDQIFTAHGIIMIIFMAMPFMIGLMNIVLPLQIGARDVAFPFLNNLSFWLAAAGAVLINISLGLGEFAKTGWLAYPPLSELSFSPGVGVDYYIWALQISGIGTLLTGVNFLVTVFKMRTPGMKLMQMPIFTWACTWANILIVASFPILTAVLGLLTLDRYLDFHFFTNSGGGNAMMYINLFWAWGHPEVYILILPAFGIFSEVISTFSSKRLFGYLHGLGQRCHFCVGFCCLVAPFFYHGVERQRKCVFWCYDHDHSSAYRSKIIQLDIHHVSRAITHHGSGVVDTGFYGDVYHRWNDRRVAGGTGCGLRIA